MENTCAFEIDFVLRRIGHGLDPGRKLKIIHRGQDSQMNARMNTIVIDRSDESAQD